MLCQIYAVRNFCGTENSDLRRKQESGKYRKWLSCLRFQRSSSSYEPGGRVLGSHQARHIKIPV